MTTDSSVLAASAELRMALGNYRLVAEIGRGRVTNVCLALVTTGDGMSRSVVLKQLQCEPGREREFRAVFENEARLGKRFHHKNVVETYGFYSDRDLCVLVMEFLEGQTLSRIRQRAGWGTQVPFSIHLRVLAEVLAGLHYLHELTDEEGKPLGIVHRDITPSNIFVTYDGRVKVVDFGVAEATTREGEALTGVVKGKIGHMSPEAARGERVDRRSDIFSVGVMLWEAATGRRLWEGHDDVAVWSRLTEGDLPTHAPDAQGTSADMIRIANRALAVDPAKRYATAEQMREELEDLLARLGYPADGTALAGYMEVLFSAEREKLQMVVDGASVRFSSHSTVQSRVLSDEGSDSYQVVDPAELVPTDSERLASGDTFKTTTSSYDVAGRASEIPKFRPSARRAFAVAGVAAAAVLGVAYGAHAPVGSPGAATAAAVTGESTPSHDEARVNANLRTAQPAARQALTEATHEGPTPARGTIAAVFLARPAHARLFLDGVALQGNPAGIRRPPDDKPHLLRIEAPGYATLVRAIDLDRDVAKEFDLAPQTSQTTDALRPAPSVDPHDDVSKRAPKPALPSEDPWGI